ncbi:MAG: tyrosine-type recombinase/integrase [Anaerolineae bacterium]
MIRFPGSGTPSPSDSLADWMGHYQALAVAGVRSPDVAAKIALHLSRFVSFFLDLYGHDRVSACLQRDVVAWQRHLLEQGLAASTVNNHLASLSAFTTWVQAQDAAAFPAGDPAKGIGELRLPPLEPRALSPRQVQTLKGLCDRLALFYRRRDRRLPKSSEPPLRASARPYRDRAVVFVLLSTGLRREELTNLDLDQLEPSDLGKLRRPNAKAYLRRVRGKGKSERVVFLSRDARAALADYLEKERPLDCGEEASALFLSAGAVPERAADGRLSPRAVNLVLERIGRLHDAEIGDPEGRISPLRPHDLRHTFAFNLARTTGADAYELERRLGHHSQRYIARYTNPPESVAAGYIEEF